MAWWSLVQSMQALVPSYGGLTGRLREPHSSKISIQGTQARSSGTYVGVGGTVFFQGTDGTNGFELWRSDGTATGTYLVKDIFPGAQSSNIELLTNVNGTLYFRANNGVNGSELWKSDGTTAGTVMVADLTNGALSSVIGSFTSINGKLFFKRGDLVTVNLNDIWVSDGTASGTFQVSSGTSIGSIGEFYGRAVFANTAGQVWTSDGISGGSMLMAESQAVFTTTSTFIQSNNKLFTLPFITRLERSCSSLIARFPLIHRSSPRISKSIPPSDYSQPQIQMPTPRSPTPW